MGGVDGMRIGGGDGMRMCVDGVLVEYTEDYNATPSCVCVSPTKTQDIAKVVTHFQPTLFEQAALMHIMYRFPAMQARMTCDNTEPWHLLYRCVCGGGGGIGGFFTQIKLRVLA